MFKSFGEKIIVGVVSAVALGAVYAAWDAISQASTGFVVPRGAVVAFDLEAGCPVGWRADFSKGEGKFILGVGSGTLRDQGPHQPNGVPNSIELTAVERDDQGGAETHTLAVEEMPAHDHGEFTGSEKIDTPGEHNWTDALGSSSHFTINGSAAPRLGLDKTLRHVHPIQSQGEGQPHNNMPPFIALYYCKKE